MHRGTLPFCVSLSLACTPSAGTDNTSVTSLVEGETSSSMSDTEGSELPNLGICEQYLTCIEAASPEAYAAYNAVYGSEGSCWTTVGMSEAECHSECRQMLRAIIDNFPEIDECSECVVDADCPTDTPYCHDDDSLCAEDQIQSCDVWGIQGQCYEFGGGFTHTQKQDWCAYIDELYGPGNVDSERTTPCKTSGVRGRCEFIASGEGLVSGPMSLFYYYDFVVPWTEANAEMSCSKLAGSTWVPL